MSPVNSGKRNAGQDEPGPATHSRQQFEDELQALRETIRSLGAMAGRAVSKSVTALRQRNMEMARDVIDGDRQIDDAAYRLEERALMLVAKQQPLATDLRMIAASLFIIGELERIGDYAEGIANLTILAGENPPLKPLIDIPHMATLATGMIEQSMIAFVDLDLDACRAIREQDDLVDDLYDQVYRELLTYMLSDPRTIEQASQLTWIAHNLERVGDRVSNICERTAYIITNDPRALHDPGRRLRGGAPDAVASVSGDELDG